MSAISFSQSRANFRWNAIELIFAAPFIVVMQQYVPVLVTRLGASPLWVGLLTSGAALSLTVAAALAPRWMQRFGTYGRAISVSLLIFRSIMLLIPLALLLPFYSAQVIVLLAIVLSLFAGFANMTLTAYLPRMAMPDQTSQLVSTRWVVLGVGMAVYTPLIAWILDGLSQPLNYIIACGIALVSGMIGIWALLRIRPVPDGPQARVQARGNTRALLAHSPARAYLVMTLLVQFAINAPAPLVTLHMVRELRATDSEFGWYLAIFWISLAIAGLGAARILRRYGNTPTFAVSMLALAAQIVILALAPSLPVTWIAGLLGGVASVFFQVSAYGLIIDCSPPDNYEGFLSVHTAMTNFCIFAAPLLVSGLVEAHWLSIGAGLILTGVLRAIAGLLAIVVLPRK
jgi:MFS family permease